MAKQLVGPVERHLEKVVIGIAGVILVGVIAVYLVASPNKLELGGEVVTPGTVNQMVSNTELEVGRRIEAHTPTVETPEPLYPEFIAALDPFEVSGLASQATLAAYFGPTVPVIDASGPVIGRKKLVEVYKLPKPAIVHGRSTFEVGAEERVLSVNNWVTVSAVFDRKEQIEIQKRQYGAKYDTVSFGPVQLQRQARRPDGSWSDDDWKDIETWPRGELPDETPNVYLADDGGEIIVPYDAQEEVGNYYEELDYELLQLELLRPLMPEVYNGTEWKFPILTSYRDVLNQDDEYLDPDETDEEPDDRYGLGEAETVTKEEETLTGRELIQLNFDRGDELLKQSRAIMQGDPDTAGDLAVDSYNHYAEVVLSKDSSGADKARAKRLMADAEQLMRDIDRIKQRKGGKPGIPGEPEEEGRELLPIQQVWAHDAGPDSVKSGETYRYRMRVLVFNELAGDAKQFENKEDATVLLVGGVWSEPSDPIHIEQDSRFFVTGFDERKKTVRVEIFRWFDGVWVTTRNNFAVGDVVRRTSRVEVPIPNSNEIDRPAVPFEPGVTLVDIDFSRPYRERKGKGEGVSFAESPSTTCSAVFVDADGRVQERFVLTDKADPDKKTLTGKVFRAP
ncbi:MAG: hypothetical protein JSU63_05545 [Phycisphaerales bacterium]|nr:MAG: hypothetical protein JSU63_05545 [Phycisphaerales bacterium]